MNASSPVKRRVLGALDPNACSPSKARRHEGKPFSSSAQHQKSPTKVKSIAPRQAFATLTSPTRVARVPSVLATPEKDMDAGSRKRRSPTPTFTPAAQDSEPAAKRACLDGTREDTQPRQLESPPPSSWTTRTSGTTRHRSASPDTPSVFDNSAVDNSQVTILTEPDTTAPAPVPAVAPLPTRRTRPRLTREQAREKAEIIRLRLGLASYKVRTGQTDVPLDRLEAQHAQVSSSPPSLPSQRQTQGHSRGPTSVSASFPPPGHASSPPTTTPGAGSRRPLPGAPLRRASSSASVSFEQEAPPSKSVLLEEARLAIARDERRKQQPQEQQQQQQLQQPRHYQHHQQHHQHPPQPQLPRHNHNSHSYNHTHSRTPHHHHHQRRQSEALGMRHDARRYMYGAEPGVPPRPRTAAGVTGLSFSSLSSSASSSFGRRASFVGDDADDREEDLEGRGGAASGLLSLARG
ncbi:uncharacterized protein B0H64DRAFT_432793 [Chaetomium fimeti]|uniref:Cyclin-dependent kinase n=1 Tax=Chaetomium fimeti TaxID=1854472 RepID=A0AAE0HGL4_9PEZI|nr:hypothetical protein B0H64DRAFT_432793 [Chaetomium fimeti]